VSSNDDITKFLCQSCCTNLKSFDEFKKLCIESDMILRQLDIKNEMDEFGTEHLMVKVEADPDCQSLSGEDDGNTSEDSEIGEPAERTPVKGEEDDQPVPKAKKWKKTSPNDRSRETRPRIECPKCDKIFHKQVRLDEHLRLHNGEKAPEICTLCNKELANPRSLKRHMKSHIGERKYICQYCQKGFVHSDTLRVHERTHLDEKNFICDECGMGFKNFVNLRVSFCQIRVM
jgi:Zinc finger, C2H2 type/C2H2-type zinc finger